MGYTIESKVSIVFQDGQALLQLQGKTIDLMRLDTVQEFRVVLQALASDALTVGFTSQAQAAPQQAATEPGTLSEADFSAVADKYGQSFQDLQQRVEQHVKDLGQTLEGATKAAGGQSGAS